MNVSNNTSQRFDIEGSSSRSTGIGKNGHVSALVAKFEKIITKTGEAEKPRGLKAKDPQSSKSALVVSSGNERDGLVEVKTELAQMEGSEKVLRGELELKLELNSLIIVGRDAPTSEGVDIPFFRDVLPFIFNVITGFQPLLVTSTEVGNSIYLMPVTEIKQYLNYNKKFISTIDKVNLRALKLSIEQFEIHNNKREQESKVGYLSRNLLNYK